MTDIAWFIGGMWHGVELFSTLAERLIRYSVSIMLLGMAGLLFLHAFNGWIGDPWTVPWITEVAPYMLVWCIFLMLGSTAKDDRHIKVSFLPYRLLGEIRGKSFVYIAESLAGLVIAIYLSKQAWAFVATSRNLHIIRLSMGGWEYPLWIVRMGILIGFIFLAFIYFVRSVNWTREFIVSRIKSSEPGSNKVSTMEIQGNQARTGAEGGPASKDGYK
jgi:TRAP-type C4-dicarboxylate transport system permease small subunit